MSGAVTHTMRTQGLAPDTGDAVEDKLGQAVDFLSIERLQNCLSPFLVARHERLNEGYVGSH